MPPPPTGAPQPAADDVGPNGSGGSWLPTPGLVRVWFRRGNKTLTQCHVQFDPPARVTAAAVAAVDGGEDGKRGGGWRRWPSRL